MKKLSVFAVAFAAMVLASCGGGNKNNQANEEADSVKSFEQAQVEAGIKMHIDSLASALGQMKQLPFMKEGDGSVELSAEEKQVKPDYMINPSSAEDVATLAEKYRLLSVRALISVLHSSMRCRLMSMRRLSPNLSPKSMILRSRLFKMLLLSMRLLNSSTMLWRRTVVSTISGSSQQLRSLRNCLLQTRIRRSSWLLSPTRLQPTLLSVCADSRCSGSSL